MVATEKPGADQREREQKCSTAQTVSHGAILLLARVFGPVLTTGRRKSATRPPDITHSEKCEARWAGRNPGCTSLNGPGAACRAVSQATASSATSSSCPESGVIHGQRSFCPSQGPERLCGPQGSQGWRESDTCKYELGETEVERTKLALKKCFVSAAFIAAVYRNKIAVDPPSRNVSTPGGSHPELSPSRDRP